MSTIDDFVARVFSMPGDPASCKLDLHPLAARAMQSLILRATQAESCRAGPLSQLTELLDRLPTRDAQRWLTHPLFFSSLHGLSPLNPVLDDWHQRVATPNMADILPADSPQQCTLGNLLLPLLLRDDPEWCGELTLRSDELGRVRFPRSNWSIALYDLHAGDEAVMAVEPIQLRVTARQAAFVLTSRSVQPVMTMPRRELMSIVIGLGDGIDVSRFELFNSEVGMSFQLAAQLGNAETRYDPICFMDVEGHAGCTGAIIAEVLKTIDHHSPTIHHEFEHYIQTIRGFELLRSRDGVVGSFSDPTLPGVMNVNIGYSKNHEPCLSPFCFTWFGHELGHTKNYLIDTIAYEHGCTFVTNHRDESPQIPRYGRALRVRTLIQIPYVHLYEWTMLMDFCVAGLDRLPWEVNEDPIAFGDSIHEEIKESLVLIRDLAQLTSVGESLLTRMIGLIQLASQQWNDIRLRLGATSRSPVSIATCPRR